MNKKMSKDWCKGFCHQCGTSCAEHEEALFSETSKLKKALERALASAGARAPIRQDVEKILDGQIDD